MFGACEGRMLRSQLVALSALCSVFTLVPAALAQPAQPPTQPGNPGAPARQPAPRTGAAPGQPGTTGIAPAAPGAPAAGQAGQPGSSAPTAPRAIEINDPLLAPPAPARNTLADWRQALQLITSRSTEVRIADQEIVRAEGIQRQALGRALPSITASGVVQHHFVRAEVQSFDFGSQTITTQTVPATPTASASLTASQPILAPRVWYGIGTAKLGVDAARYEASDLRRTVLGAVASGILGVVTAERLAEINRVGLRSALETLELTDRRARLGTGTKLDVVRAEQDVMLARTQIISGDESLRQAREALGLALGTNEQYGVPQTISMNEMEQTILATCAPGKPTDRPDVRAAETSVTIAERQVTDARLGFAPVAEVSTTAQVSTEPIIADKHYAWSIQGVLTIPIWDGGSRYGEIRSAKAGVEQQKARLDATRRSAELETTQAMRSIAVAEQARDLAAKARDLATETARLSQVAFEAGTGTSFDLVESARRQRQAELDLVVREFEVVRAKLSALLATASCTY